MGELCFDCEEETLQRKDSFMKDGELIELYECPCGAKEKRTYSI